jgi:hypothetical protein
MIELQHNNFELAVCTVCSLRNKYHETIGRALEKEYSTELEALRSEIGIRADNPFWVAYHKEIRNYQTKCLVFEYGDAVEALCLDHLQEVLQEMKDNVSKLDQEEA